MTDHAQTPGTVPAAVPGAPELVKRTLAAAYRQQAGWTDDSNAIQDLLSLAAQVERFEPGDPCCPCCQEVTCDTGCPLEPVRQP